MKRILFTSLIIALLLAGCADSNQRSLNTNNPQMPELFMSAGAPAVGGGAEGERMDVDLYAAPGESIAFDQQKNFAATGEVTQPQQERLVIQNVDLIIIVSDPTVKMDAINAMAERMGGFVVSSNLYQNYTQSGQKVPEGRIMVRIPAEKLDEALDEIKQGVSEVDYENRSGQDVTQSYIDLKSRLKNLELAEQQLQEILDKTTDPEAVVNLFNQLVYYREQIELVKGQMQYFEQSAALSAVSVRIVAEESIAPIEIGGWKPQGVARDATQALVNFLQGFVNVVIYMVILIIPGMVVILSPLWLVWRGLRRLVRGKNNQPAKPAGAENNALSKSG